MCAVPSYSQAAQAEGLGPVTVEIALSVNAQGAVGSTCDIRSSLPIAGN
jgi:hypothetical protein